MKKQKASKRRQKRLLKLVLAIDLMAICLLIAILLSQFGVFELTSEASSVLLSQFQGKNPDDNIVFESQAEGISWSESESEEIVFESQAEGISWSESESEESESIASYSEEDLEILAHLIYGEAGDQSDECQRTVGAVVLNRVKHKWYPNTIKGVVFQRGQYACTWDGNYDKEPSERAWANAKWVLEGNSDVPENVIYQAQFKQGSGIYKVIGTEIFCYE